MVRPDTDEPRPLIYIRAEHLGGDATEEQARKVVQRLMEKGYEEVRYGVGPAWRFVSDFGGDEERDEDTVRAAFESAFDSVVQEVLSD